MPFTLLSDAGTAPRNELYEVIIEGAPVMLWLGDVRGKCVFLNRLQREFWGVEIEDVAHFDWTTTVHPDDLEAMGGPFQHAMTNHTPMEVEARFRRASDGAWRILRTSAAPRFDAAGRFVGMVGVNIDVTDQRAAEDELRHARDAIALATRSSQLGWITWQYGEGATDLDQRAREILGAEPDEEVTWDFVSRMPPEDRVALESEIRASASSGRPYNLFVRIAHADGSEHRVQASGMVERAADGTPTRGTGLLRDVTEEWREEEFTRLLMGELRHRNKNLLSIVTALVNQTSTEGRDAREFQKAVTGRLAALAAGMEITEDGNASRFDVARLARTVLAPYRQDAPDRVRLDGEALMIDTGFSRSLGLALHELATNAVKYGALSNEDGVVDVAWGRENGQGPARFTLSWRERGGPPCADQDRTGFGSRLLRDVVALETGGTARYEMTPQGLHYDLSFRL